MSAPAEPFDVAIVGAGVVGAAVARLLSFHRLRVVLVEGGSDVGAGTSKANTAILHTGFDAPPGTVESRLVARGYQLLRSYAPGAGIALEETGAVLVAWDDAQAAALGGLATKARANGYQRAEIVDAATVYDLEPHLAPGAHAGLVIPDEHIIDPWATPLAFATEAVLNGAELRRSSPVTAITAGHDDHQLHTPGGPLRARFLVNAAGLHADELHRRLGHDSFTVTPRRGELIVFDKLARGLLHRTILPVPTATTKGVLIAPTVFGNVMLGPTADDIEDKSATGSTRGGIDRLLAQGRRILPALIDEEVTAVYAGLRSATEHGDYVIELHADQRYVCLGGIRSTGLTASMAVAEEAARLLADAGLVLEPRPSDELIA
ncbi:MAG TPA: FAD-dependent oxidoreductase, partial [Acidimicrobiales bacterium]